MLKNAIKMMMMMKMKMIAFLICELITIKGNVKLRLFYDLAYAPLPSQKICVYTRHSAWHLNPTNMMKPITMHMM